MNSAEYNHANKMIECANKIPSSVLLQKKRSAILYLNEIKSYGLME